MTDTEIRDLPATLTFEDIELRIIDRDGKPWLTAQDVGCALGYAGIAKGGRQTDIPFDRDAASNNVRKLYERRADEFAEDETCLLMVQTEGGPQEVRVFSPRGARLLAMFARTDRAKAFRRWVLDVLDHLDRLKVVPQEIDPPRELGGQKLTPGQRFAEERRRLGYATRRDFAVATGIRLNIITSFEELNAPTNKLLVVYRLIDAGFDLRYWQTGVRTPYRPVGPEESALLQAWRRAGVDGVRHHLAHALSAPKREK